MSVKRRERPRAATFKRRSWNVRAGRVTVRSTRSLSRDRSLDLLCNSESDPGRCITRLNSDRLFRDAARGEG